MFSTPWAAFLVAFAGASLFFVFAKRRSDFLTVAFIGAAFYFSPLLFGYVMQAGPYDTSIPAAVYWIGTGFIVLLTISAVASDVWLTSDPKPKTGPARPMSPLYLVVAIAGLAAALIGSRGAIINFDKLEVLKHVGYAYTAFEVGACLAFLSAVVERRLWVAAAAAFLLLVDVFVGFRMYIVFAAVATPVLLLRTEGKVRLWNKKFTYGAGAIVFVVAILLASSARLAVFNLINKDGVIKAAQMRADSVQFIVATEMKGPSWIMVPIRIYMQSEPFLTQSVLVDVERTGMSCKPSNILKSVYLLVPPGLSRFFPNPYPPTFYDEYQPVLFPGLNYGLGGNVWAEMLCRFGYMGDAIFAVLMLASLILGYRWLLRSSAPLAVPITLGAVIVGFYFHRNDIAYTLVLLRQVAILSGFVWLLSLVRRPAAAIAKHRHSDGAAAGQGSVVGR